VGPARAKKEKKKALAKENEDSKRDRMLTLKRSLAVGRRSGSFMRQSLTKSLKSSDHAFSEESIGGGDLGIIKRTRMG